LATKRAVCDLQRWTTHRGSKLEDGGRGRSDNPDELRAELAAALREIDVLRAENALLRSMLRLDRGSAVQAPLPAAEFAG
jgi:hypothetical protein